MGTLTRISRRGVLWLCAALTAVASLNAATLSEAQLKIRAGVVRAIAQRNLDADFSDQNRDELASELSGLDQDDLSAIFTDLVNTVKPGDYEKVLGRFSQAAAAAFPEFRTGMLDFLRMSVNLTGGNPEAVRGVVAGLMAGVADDEQKRNAVASTALPRVLAEARASEMDTEELAVAASMGVIYGLKGHEKEVAGISQLVGKVTFVGLLPEKGEDGKLPEIDEELEKQLLALAEQVTYGVTIAACEVFGEGDDAARGATLGLMLQFDTRELRGKIAVAAATGAYKDTCLKDKEDFEEWYDGYVDPNNPSPPPTPPSPDPEDPDNPHNPDPDNPDPPPGPTPPTPTPPTPPPPPPDPPEPSLGG